jgi:dTDP-glucose 4,6-dehydratase
MRLIITGGAGFIGSNLIKFLLKNKKFKILNYDALKYSANLKSLDFAKKNKNYYFYKGNICDNKKFLKLINSFRPDSIINLAAESHVDRSIDDPAPFLKTNIFGTYSLLKSCLAYWKKLPLKKKKSFKFLHVSTDEVYGDLFNNKKLAKETDPYNPSSPYAASKASSDHLVMAWNKTFNFPSIITNCSNNYGPNQHPEKYIPHVILSALRKKKIPIYGNGEQIRDWIHVEDHVKGIIKVLLKGKIGETYNIGAFNKKKNLEVAKEICKILDKIKKNKKKHSSYIQFVYDRPGHDRRYAINSNKIKKLGWRPNNNFKNGLFKTVFWYLDNKNWWDRIVKKKYKLKRIGKI